MTGTNERIRLLFVADRTDASIPAAAVLERDRARFDVQCASTVREAVRRLADGSIDCVVSAYRLPEETGVDLLETVRTSDPELPFVLFAAEGSESVASEAISAGVDDYHRHSGRPDQIEALADDVAELVDRRRFSANVRSTHAESGEGPGQGSQQRAFSDLALDTLDDVVYVVGAAGEMKRWNRRLSEVTGYTDEQIAGMSATEFFPEDDRESIADAIQTTVLEGRAVTEADLLTRGGTRIPYELTGARLTDPDGDLTGLVGVGRDITDRLRRERRLERYERLVDAMLDPACIYDESGRYEVVNASLADRHCTTPERLEGDDSALVEHVRTSGEGDPFQEIVDGDREQYRGEYTAEFPERGASVVEYRLSRITVDDEFGGVVAVSRDVTERKRREQSLVTLQAAMRGVMDASDETAVAELAVETARSVLGQPIATVWLYDESRDALQPAASTEAARDLLVDVPTYTDEDSLSWHAFVTGDLEVYDDLRSEPDRYDSGTALESEIVLPLGEYGVMNLGSTTSTAFDDVDVSLAELVGDVFETAFARLDRER